MLRRIRGALGTAFLWGGAWSLAGLVVCTVEWIRLRHLGVPASVVATGTLQYAAAGAIGGAVFAIALSSAERHEGGIGALSVRRTATWGALGGLALPLCFVAFVLASPVHIGFTAAALWTVGLLAFGSSLGAASAAGSLALARRAPKVPEQLSPADADFGPSLDVIERSAAMQGR